MVDLKTAIRELNDGTIELTYPSDSGCTTAGELIILLERLAELEAVISECDLPDADSTVSPEGSRLYIEQKNGKTHISKIVPGYKAHLATIKDGESASVTITPSVSMSAIRYDKKGGRA